jgi:hypothetical protein
MSAEARVRAEFAAAVDAKRFHADFPRVSCLRLKTATRARTRHGGIDARIWFS